jgi:hypothetical protein
MKDFNQGRANAKGKCVVIDSDGLEIRCRQRQATEFNGLYALRRANSVQHCVG